MKIAFLGTSAAMPTKERNAAAHAVWVKGKMLLLDCGEAAQRQLRRSSMRLTSDAIFLTHLHLDHILGVPGYLATLDLLGREGPFPLYVPVGARAWVANWLAPLLPRTFELVIEELDDGSVVKFDGFRVVAARVDHVAVSLGFRIEEDERPGKVDVGKARALGLEPGRLLGELVKGRPVQVGDRWIHPEQVVGAPRPGRSLIYSGDTRPCPTLTALAKNADLLLHESTFTHRLHEEACQRAHTTSLEAARVAREADVRRLALTHVSHRHQDRAGLQEMLEEARAVFPDTFLPSDLDEFEVPLAD